MLGGMALLVLAMVLAGGFVLREWDRGPDFPARLLPPSILHPFGTDALGHDLTLRVIEGLGTSLWVGLVAANLSALIATALALLSALGRGADAFVSFLVDAAMGLPHLVLLVLISFALGGGTGAVIAAVALTHWPRLTRILRAELLQVMSSDYVIASRRFGRSRAFVAMHHVLPHLMPQMLVGLVLLFPHAILHEAALTFLGFGLEPSEPAIGILLADALRWLSAGKWWLGVFPGLCLLLLVLCFDALGNGLRALLDPRSAAL